MPQWAGARIGSYEVIALLGEGGMGEVYRARDPRLNRDVAIKVLHASVATDPERLRRFMAEAQAVAALNHPNVLTIHEVGTHEGHPFLATELLEGETLRARLEAGAIPPSKAIDFARQAASGLAAAHAKGIAHRDIKPENLFITTDGRLKILDFGLAKALDKSDVNQDATRMQSATEAGVVLGTVGYMSPEQVRAQPLDHRTDIFSLGIVLYEMLAGQRPFAGGSAVETMNAILTVDPPEIVPAGKPLPAGVTQVVRHCLEKNAEERFQSARDLSFALQALASSSASGSSLSIAGSVPAASVAATSPGSNWRWLGLAAAVLAGGVIGAGIAIGTRSSTPELDLRSYNFTPFATDPEPETDPTWSHDGRSLAFVKDARIWVRSLDSDDATPVTSGRLGIFRLFWFPDNTRIGFVSGGGVFAVSRAGGDPERLQEGAFQAAALSPDGNTLALWKVTAEGSSRTASLWFASPVTSAPKQYELGFLKQETFSPNYLTYSPDGRRLIYTGYSPKAYMWMIPIEAAGPGAPQRLFQDTNWTFPPQASWMPDSRTMVLCIDDELWLGDIEHGTLSKITAGVHRLQDPAVSPDGKRIAFAAGETDYDLVEIPIRDEPVTDFLASARREVAAAWMPSSANAKDVVYITDKSGALEIRTRRTADGGERVVLGARSFATGGVGELMTVTPSPDSSRILFTRFDGKNGSAWIAPMAGGNPVRVGPGDLDQWMAIFSPDGREVVYVVSDRGAARMLKTRVGSTEAPATLLDSSSAIFSFYVEWSPTNEWIAYQTEKALALISPDGKSRRDLVAERGLAVAWARDGKTLHAITPGDPKSPSVDLISIDVATGQVRTRRKLPPTVRPSVPYSPGLRMSLNPEGTKLLVPVVRIRADLWMLER